MLPFLGQIEKKSLFAAVTYHSQKRKPNFIIYLSSSFYAAIIGTVPTDTVDHSNHSAGTQELLGTQTPVSVRLPLWPVPYLTVLYAHSPRPASEQASESGDDLFLDLILFHSLHLLFV